MDEGGNLVCYDEEGVRRAGPEPGTHRELGWRNCEWNSLVQLCAVDLAKDYSVKL